MRFLTKALIAVSALFFVSSADAFYYPASSSLINPADTNHHLSALHAHLQSSHNDLLSTMKSVHYHTQSVEDCTAVLFAGSRTADKVKACLSISGSAAFDSACAADLNSQSCSIAIGTALQAYAGSGNIPIAGGTTDSGISGGSTSGPSEQCTNALSQYTKNVQTQCGALQSKVTGASTSISTATDINSLINAQCTLFTSDDFKSCTNALSAFTSVVDACPEYGLDKIKGSFSQLLSLTDGPLTALCTKDDNDSSKYCLATVLPTFQNDFDISKLTDSTLNTICKPCMQTIVNKIASFGGQISGAPSNAVGGLTSSMKYFNVLCTKDPTNPSKYCFNIFASLSSLGDKAKTATFPTNDDFRAICSPCMKAILVQGGDIFGAGELNALKAFESYCTKEPSSGNYCGTTVFGKFQNILGSLSVCDGTTCSDACKSAVSAIYSDQSCCFATVGFQTVIAAISDIPALSAFLPKLAVASTCAIDVSTKKCTLPAPAALSIDLSLPNIAYDKITGTTNAAASASIKLALQKDISLALGVDASAVIINDFSSNPSAKGGVKVSITITVDASFKSSYQSTINAKLSQSGGLPLPSTAQSVEQNKAALVAGEPVSAGGQAASGAINNNASIIVIAMATIIALFFKF